MDPNAFFRTRTLFFTSLLVLELGARGTLRGQPSWSVQLPGIGTFSSPRVADLTSDGTGDVILGAGREELTASDSAVIALDGATGQLLWRVAARDQIFGSAALRDISGDSIPDVVIGGRSAELKAIDGATGSVLWEFFPATRLQKARKAGWYNFYNPQFVPDQNNDGLEDILVSNGGDVLVEPHDPNRPTGHLLVLSARDGKLLAKAPMPDGKEIYMSVVAFPNQADWESTVIFGTGGETIGGNLYATTLSDIMRDDLSSAQLLASSPDKGFIAPPVAVDLNGDARPEVIALSVAGDLLALKGSLSRRSGVRPCPIPKPTARWR